MPIVPRGISVPGSQTPGFSLPQKPNIRGSAGNPFQGGGQQPNLFDTINTAIQLRRKSQREALEDKIAERQAAVAEKELLQKERKLDLDTAIEERKLNAPSIMEQLQGISGANGLAPGTTASFKDPATGLSISTPLNRELTQGESTTSSQAEAIVAEIDELDELIGTSAEFLGALPFGGGTSSGQNFRLLRNNINERLVRLRSGAQINEEEFKRLTKLLPTLTRKKDVDKKQLARFRKEFSVISNRILGGQNASGTQPISLTIAPEGERGKQSFSQEDEDLLRFVMEGQ